MVQMEIQIDTIGHRNSHEINVIYSESTDKTNLV